MLPLPLVEHQLLMPKAVMVPEGKTALLEPLARQTKARVAAAVLAGLVLPLAQQAVQASLSSVTHRR